MAYTLQQLQQMGATPVQAPTQTGGTSYTVDQLNSMGATPVTDQSAEQPTAQNPISTMISGYQNAPSKILDFVGNNPVTKALTSLTALPVQLGVKGYNAVTRSNIPDPYATGIGGGKPPVPITSSDQSPGGYATETLGNAVTAGSLAIPVEGLGVKLGAGLAEMLPAGFSRIFGSLAAKTLTGYATDVGTNLQNKSDMPFTPGLGTVTAGGLGLAGELGGALVDNFASKSATTRLTAQTNNLKTLTRSFDDNISYAKDTTGKVVKVTDPIKTITSLPGGPGLTVVDGSINASKTRETIQNLLADQDKQAKTMVKNMPGGQSLTKFKQDVVKAINANPSIRDAGKVPQALAEVDRRFLSYESSFGENVPYTTVDDIRTAMNREFDPENRDVARTIGDTARGYLYSDSGNPALKAIMAREGDLIKADTFAEKLNGTKVKGGRLGKYLADATGATIGAGIGGAIGGPFGAAIGTGVGGWGTDKLVTGMQNRYFNPLMAGPAQKLQNAVSTPAMSVVKQIPSKLGAFIPRSSK